MFEWITKCHNVRVLHRTTKQTVVFGVITLCAYLQSLDAHAEPVVGAVEIWVRAYIPGPQNAGAAGGYIVNRPGNPGQSMVRLLPTDQLPAKPAPSCYVTDGRGFSSADGSTARIETRFTLTPRGAGGEVSPAVGRTTAGATIEVNCADGIQIAAAPGKVERDTIGTPAFADGTLQVIGQVQGKNELAAWGLAPSIDYSFDVKWTPWMGELNIALNYGSFPSVEVYARVKGGAWLPVHRHMPSGTPWNLAGDSFGISLSRDEKSISLPSTEGTWNSSDSDKRFRVQILNGKLTLIEKSSTGQSLRREVTAELRTDGSLRISRPNDVEVLTFLGFQPSLRAEILSRSPLPSYIDLKFEGNGLIGDWYGLLITKDANAHLKELIQPGTRPPKSYNFSR